MPAPAGLDPQTRDRLISARLLTRGTGHRTFLRVVGIIALISLLALLLPWQQTVRANGSVTALAPADRPQSVQAQVGGRIDAWLVAEGDSVRRGDPIVRLAEVGTEFLDPEVLTREAERLRQVSHPRGA